MSTTAVMIDFLTPRLRLHALTVAEAHRIVAGRPSRDDHWADGFPREDDQDGVGAFLRAAAAGDDPSPFGCYRIDLAGIAVGTIGFFGPPDAEGQVTIGYGLVPAARGCGYATEAVGRMVALCQAHEGARMILAETEVTNVASHRVLEKNGFVVAAENGGYRQFRLDVRPRA